MTFVKWAFWVEWIKEPNVKVFNAINTIMVVHTEHVNENETLYVRN